MLSSIETILTLLPVLAYCKTSGDLCWGSAHEDNGNWYCTEVSAITYHNISSAGFYNKTTRIDPNTGLCTHERVAYSATGTDAPFFGQVSVHLRGPVNIAQMAVYSLASSIYGRSIEDDDVAGIAEDRLFVSPANAETRLSPTEQTGGSPVQQNLDARSTEATTFVTMARTHTKAKLEPRQTPLGADWRRVASYTSAASAQATGLRFLANLGDPQKSGTFDYAFGNSLSYVSEDGTTVTAQPKVFDGLLRTSEDEISIFADQKCDQNCEYFRPGSVAYYGWKGVDKAFFLQFQMDHRDNAGTDQGLLSDAPALWFLNADVPRILQYGSDRNNVPCSCWSTGCGEFDAFEVLSRGDERAKSTLHRQGNLQGGDSNYFKRPVGRMLKLAVVFHNFNITVMVLPDNFDFSATISASAMENLIRYDPKSNSHSMFSIGQ